jgi:hypothetical protein
MGCSSFPSYEFSHGLIPLFAFPNNFPQRHDPIVQYTRPFSICACTYTKPSGIENTGTCKPILSDPFSGFWVVAEGQWLLSEVRATAQAIFDIIEETALKGTLAEPDFPWRMAEQMREDCGQPAAAREHRLLEGCQWTIFESCTLRPSLPRHAEPRARPATIPLPLSLNCPIHSEHSVCRDTCACLKHFH